MTRTAARLLLALVVSGATMLASWPAAAAQPPTSRPANPTVCAAGPEFHSAWIKVIERNCLKCHNATGDARETRLVLIDPAQVPVGQRPTALSQNCVTLTRMAHVRELDGRARLLDKARGGLDHGGGEVVKAGSSEERVLKELLESLDRAAVRGAPGAEIPRDDVGTFFDGVRMVSDQRLLRRVTLSLAARLPTDQERQSVATEGHTAIQPIMDALMREEAFYQRLMEGFNDILLTLGYNGSGESILSYNHFQPTRLWYQKHSLDHLPEKDRQKARYKLADQYREALRREPLELIRHIVEQNRPFTELLTANYIMVSPYSARGYGLYEELKDRFEDPDNPFEYIPARLKALKHRDGKLQPSADGYYPHAGLLTTFQYLRRYPTTETNRNRLRARMYYQHFLGVDIMNLAPRVSDAAAIDAQYEIPTMQAAECVVCHRTIDPVAGLFQDYFNEEGHYGPRPDGWFEDMFEPGCEGTDLPEPERWRSLQWLGEQTIRDPRFAVAMAEHVYYILMGRQVLQPPADIDDPHFAARRRAYLAQRAVIEQAADRFRTRNHQLKVLFQELVNSPLYRADGLAEVVENPSRAVELEEIGLVRMLGPEQIERKIQAVFGRPWGRLQDSYTILYGGIDSQEVTERLTEPSGAIGALQRIMANAVACQNVAADFALPPAERRLFPGIEPSVTPDSGSQSEQTIRSAIVHLHSHILGRDDQPDDVDVDLTYRLFTEILADARAQGRFEPVESYFCKSTGQEGPRDPDPHYTIRAWRAVVTYLLRQRDFLYE